MTPNEYQEHCLRTWQGGGGRSTTEELANAGMGLAGEAGEVANAMKKVLWYGKPLDVEVIADELGDVLYYAAILAQRVGVTFEAVMVGNVEKLAKRHPDGFDRSHYADDMRPRGALEDVGPDYEPAPVDNENGRVYRRRLGAMAMKYLDVP